MSYQIKGDDLDIRINEKDNNDITLVSDEVLTTSAQVGIYELPIEATGDSDKIVMTGFNNTNLDAHLDKLAHLYSFDADNTDIVGSEDLSGSYTEVVSGRYESANGASSLSSANPLLDSTNNFILSLWSLFSDRVAENIFSQATGIDLSRNADETLTLTIGPDTITTSHKARVNRWLNIVVIRDGDDVSLYLDGDHVGGFTLSAPGALTATGPTNIFDYSGAVDEIAIFNDITEPIGDVVPALNISPYNDITSTVLIIDGVYVSIPDGLTARAIARVIAGESYPNYDVTAGYNKCIFTAKTSGVGAPPSISKLTNTFPLSFPFTFGSAIAEEVKTIVEGFDSKDLRGITLAQTELFDDVPQRLKIRLQYFFSEWRFNMNLGLPYIQKVFSGTFSKSEVDAIFKDVIIKTRGVLELVEFRSEFNHAQRNYTLDFTVKDSNGREVKISHGNN